MDLLLILIKGFIFLLLVFGIYMWISHFLESIQKKAEAKNNLIKQAKMQEYFNVENKCFSRVFNEIDSKISQIKNLELPKSILFKELVVENEKLILEHGNEKHLHDFLRVSNFLGDIEKYLDEMINRSLSTQLRENKVYFERNRHSSPSHITSYSIDMDNKFIQSCNYSLNQLIEQLPDQIQSLKYFIEIASAMIFLHLENNKLLYLEIYEVFDKIGVFDTTWQKKMMFNIENLDSKLSDIQTQFSELNRNFSKLNDSNELIILNLKGINNSNSKISEQVQISNIIQGITAYQTWRIRKKISK
jgi:hypothetical protein